MARKGENIYKRKDKRWEARYIKGHAPSGQAQYGYCYGKSYREVKEKLATAKASWQAGMLPIRAKGQPLSFYCDQWLQLCQDRVKDSTYVKYRTILERHIRPLLGDLQLDALSTSAIQQFGHTLLHQKGLSPKTVRDILTVLHAILRFTAKETPLLSPKVEIIYPKADVREMRVLSREEQQTLISYLQQSEDACKRGTLLALLTGMRIGEVCALRWGDISLEEGVIRVSHTMQRLQNFEAQGVAKTRIVISTPKSTNGARIIPLTSQAQRLCAIGICSDPDAYFLTGHREMFIEPRTLQYRLARYCKECGLEGVHFHTLRHTFATRCVEVDFELKSLSEILGHANPRITLERYVHTSLQLKRSNIAKLSAVGF